MADNAPKGSGSQDISLGIRGVPDRLNRLAGGMIYAFALDQQALRLTLVARALLSALRAGIPCAFVSPLDPSMLLRKAELIGLSLAEFADSGQLRIHRQRADLQNEMLPMNAKWLLNEVRQFKIPPGAFVVFDHADERFCIGDPASAGQFAQSYQEWVDQNGHTVLAMFMPRPQAPRDYVTLRTVAEHFGGFALVRSVDDEPILDVRHWFGPMGALTRASWALSIDGQGTISGRPAAIAGRVSIDPTREQQIVTRRAAEAFETEGWRVAETLLEALDRARSVEGGTVVLPFERAAGLRDLCQAVALLRGLDRPQLRIVVRECGARLRLPQMVALLRLGVSTVIPKDVTGPAARYMAESLKGTLFTRHFATDVDQVLAETAARTETRALAVDEFRDQVRQLVGWADQLDLPCTLVRFSLASTQALRAALGALQRGARDCLFTEHDGCIWALLFGCVPEHADTVLARLLGARFENLLADLQRIGGSPDILARLRLLDHAVVDPADAVFADTVIRTDDTVVPVDFKTR